MIQHTHAVAVQHHQIPALLQEDIKRVEMKSKLSRNFANTFAS